MLCLALVCLIGFFPVTSLLFHGNWAPFTKSKVTLVLIFLLTAEYSFGIHSATKYNWFTSYLFYNFWEMIIHYSKLRVWVCEHSDFMYRVWKISGTVPRSPETLSELSQLIFLKYLHGCSAIAFQRLTVCIWLRKHRHKKAQMGIWYYV